MGLGRYARVLVCCLLLASLCACQKQVKLPGKSTPRFYSQTGQPLREADLAPFFREADFILVGENHRNSCDHVVQAHVVSLAGRQRPDCVVGMEMLFPDQQPVLDDFFQGGIRLEELGEALDWKRHWGHPFMLYYPVFAATRAAGLRLCFINEPRERIRRIATGREQIDFPFVSACPQQKERLRDVFVKHKAMLGKDADENRFFKTQALWDSAMAWNATRAREKGPVLVLAGSGHVENGWGIEYRLRQLVQSANIVRFTPVRSIAELRQMQADNIDADTTVIFFLCPAKQPSQQAEK